MQVLAEEGIRVCSSMFTDHFPDIIGKGLRDAQRAFQLSSVNSSVRDRGGRAAATTPPPREVMRESGVTVNPLHPTADRA